MYRLVRVFAYVKLFTQRLKARMRRKSSNNHTQSQPAIDHSNTYHKPKPKAVSDKEQDGNVQQKSSDNGQDYQHLQHSMKPRDKSLNNFTEKNVPNQPSGKPMRRFEFLQQQSKRTSSVEYLLSKRLPRITAPSSVQP